MCVGAPNGAIENAHAFSCEATEAVLDFDMGDRKGRPYGTTGDKNLAQL